MKKMLLYVTGFFIFSANVVSAQTISPDRNFGNDGLLKQSFTLGTGNGMSVDNSYDLMTLPDNSVLVFGTSESSCTQKDFSVIKFLPDGQLDKSFNGSGFSIISLTPDEDWAYAGALQSDGKIVLAGSVKKSSSDFDFAVARMNADGSLDKTFNNVGYTLIDFGGYDQATHIDLWGDKIVVAGYSIFSGDTSYAVARLNAEGIPDNTFNGSGSKRFAENGAETISDMAVDTDGRIHIAGYNQIGTSNSMYVVRVAADGNYDASFDGDGKKAFQIHSYMNILTGMHLQNNGKIILNGQAADKMPQVVIDQTIIRLNTDGSFDQSFGINGIVLDNQLQGVPSKIVADADGNIISANRNFASTSYTFFLYKIDVNGNIDTDFGVNGYSDLAIGGYRETTAIELDAEGRIVSAALSPGNGFTVIRCLADGSLDSGFGNAGHVARRLSTSSETVSAMQYTKAGGILIGGHLDFGWFQPVLSRLDANGNLDPSFADGAGTELYPLTGYAQTTDILELQDKSFLHVIYNKAIKMTEAGKLDASFNTVGYVDFDFGDPLPYAKKALQTADGALIVAGLSINADMNIAVMKLKPTGEPDNTFGTDGKVKLLLSDYLPGKVVKDYKLTMQVLSDDKILLSGNTDGVFVIRLNKNGTVDNTFGSNGAYLLPDDKFTITDLNVQPDGKILLGGSIAVFPNMTTYTVYRAKADGSGLDDSFNATGKFMIEEFEYGEVRKVYSNNKHILIFGTGSHQNVDLSHVIIQLNMDGSVVPGFNNGTYLEQAIPEGAYNTLVSKSADGKLLATNLLDCRYIAMQYLTDQTDGSDVVTSILSGPDSGNTNGLVLFPNPASGSVNLKLMHSDEVKGDLSITAASGCEVKHINAYIFAQNFSIDNLAPGLYFVQVKTEGGKVFTQKLIVR